MARLDEDGDLEIDQKIKDAIAVSEQKMSGLIERSIDNAIKHHETIALFVHTPIFLILAVLIVWTIKN